jgi:hypothetical protein
VLKRYFLLEVQQIFCVSTTKFLCEYNKLFMEIFFISAKFGKKFLWKYDIFFVEVRQNFCGKTLFSPKISYLDQSKYQKLTISF